jgi:DNA-binding XRE family transcriptional regulator
MTADDLKAWRAMLNLNLTQAGEQLGVHRNSMRNYESGETAIPLTVALACAALAFNLPPWRAPTAKKRKAVPA